VPGKINKYPAGFLSLLDSKTGGQTPFNSADLLQPTVDMREFYDALNYEQVIGLTAAIGAVGNFPDTSAATAGTNVPNNEFWVARNLSFTASDGLVLGAGEIMQYGIQLLRTGFTSFYVTELVRSTAGQVPGGVSILCPFVMLPGSLLGVKCTEYAVGNTAIQMDLRFNRYRI